MAHVLAFYSALEYEKHGASLIDGHAWILDDAPALQEPDDQHHDREHEQNVDQAAANVERKSTEQPHNNEHNDK